MTDNAVEKSWWLAAIGLTNLFVILLALALRKPLGLPHLCVILSLCVALSILAIALTSRDESK